MITGDGTYIKKLNRSLIIRKIIEHGMISRADLSKITGLNKATISVQVAALLEEQLIIESQQEHHTVGRRPIMLSLNHRAGYVLGIDLDYGRMIYTLSDLSGVPVYSDLIHLPFFEYDEIVNRLTQLIQEAKKRCSVSLHGLIGVMIGIHGTVSKDETIFFVPKYQWHHKTLKSDLEAKLDVNISLENNANLAAFAERVYQYHQSNHLLCINLASGIGSGIIIDGKILQGYHGYAGEMGHMIISPDGEPCKCGNRGCWELYASESSLLQRLALKKKQPNLTYEDIRLWIAERDSTTMQQLEQFIKYLSVGLNNVINLYNPETVVLNNEALTLYPDAIEKIKSQLKSSVSQYREITLSSLGKSACVMGACAITIQQFLEVPELRLNLDREHSGGRLTKLYGAAPIY